MAADSKEAPKALDNGQLDKYAEDLARLYHLERQRRAELDALSLQLSAVEEKERARLAEVLHDTIVQTLALVKMQLDRAGLEWPEARLHEIARLVEKSISEARTLMYDISPSVILDLGLIDALEWFVESMRKKHGLDIDLIADDGVEVKGDDVKLILFNAVRELIMNAAKHAHASQLTITLARGEGDILISVEDDGRGFDPSQAQPQSGEMIHFGLLNIRHRIGHIGGSVEITSALGKGTTVTLRCSGNEEGVRRADAD